MMNASTNLRSLSRASQRAIRVQHPPLALPRAVFYRSPSSILFQRPALVQQPARPICGTRFHSSDASPPAHPRDLTDREGSPASDAEAIAARKAQEPAYQMTFTCTKCSNRSSHRITKQAYHHGTVLVRCPGCRNRHLISDHMKIFSDKSVTIENIMKEKGQYIRKGLLGADGDIEFYDEEGTQAQEPKTPT